MQTFLEVLRQISEKTSESSALFIPLSIIVLEFRTGVYLDSLRELPEGTEKVPSLVSLFFI